MTQLEPSVNYDRECSRIIAANPNMFREPQTPEETEKAIHYQLYIVLSGRKLYFALQFNGNKVLLETLQEVAKLFNLDSSSSESKRLKCISWLAAQREVFQLHTNRLARIELVRKAHYHI